MKSIFTDKNITPSIDDLSSGLRDTFQIWQDLETFTTNKFPKSFGAWHHSGDKYGWSYRISDQKRVLIYLLPRDRFFKAALVFGQKAMDKILESPISDGIKNELLSAKAYAEGRGIRIDVRDTSKLADIKMLIDIKITS